MTTLRAGNGRTPSGADGAARPAVQTPVGRSVPVEDVVRLLGDPRARLVTVAGGSGMGRSVVARSAAECAARRYGGTTRQLAVSDLTHLTDLTDLTELTDPADSAELAELTARGTDAPAAGPQVLLLDDLDALAPAAVTAILESLPPGAALLGCAVRPLGVTGERVVTIGPLAAPEGDTDAADVVTSPSAALLLQALGDPDGAHLTDDDLVAIGQLCRATGGWPMALMRVAAACGTSTPADLWAENRGGHGLLDRLDGDEFVLTAALNRTYSRLHSPARALLRALSVFAGGFTPDQAAQVAPTAATSRRCQALVDVGLLLSTGPGGTRFVMPAVVRSFAARKLSWSPEARRVRTRHAELVAGVVDEAATFVYDGDPERALDTLGPLRADALPALDWLLARGTTEAALRLAGALASCLAPHGHTDPLRDRLNTLLMREDLPAGPELAIALVGYAQLAFAGVTDTPVTELAVARWQQGIALTRSGAAGQATLWALSLVAFAMPVTGDAELGAACVAEAIALASRTGHVRWLARFEAGAGLLANLRGDVGTAAAMGSAALARGRRCGDQRARILAGVLLLSLPADVPVAERPAPEELLALAEQISEPQLDAAVLAVMAMSSLARGGFTEAAAWCARGLHSAARARSWHAAVLAIVPLFRVACALGDRDNAALLHGVLVGRVDVLAASLGPTAAAEYQVLAAGLEAVMDPSRFRSRMAVGAGLSWDEATSAALDCARAMAAGADRPRRRAAASSRGVVVDALAALSPREMQVLRLLAKGLPNAAIAAQLHLTQKSVMHVVSRIFRKIGVSNRAQAGMWAQRNGVESPDPA